MKRSFLGLFFLGFLTGATPPTKSYLSIQGGALAGLIPAILLKEVEQQTGTSVTKLFDGMVGSSIGAVIAGVASIPQDYGSKEPKYSMNEIEAMLEEFSPHAFSFFSTMGQSMLFGWNIFPMLGSTYLSQVVTELCVQMDNKHISDRYELFCHSQALLHSERDMPLWQALRGSTSLTHSQRIEFNTTTTPPVYSDAGLSGGNDPTPALCHHIPSNESATIYVLGTGFGGRSGISACQKGRVKLVYIVPNFEDREKSSWMVRPVLIPLLKFVGVFPSYMDDTVADLNIISVFPRYKELFREKAKKIIDNDSYFQLMIDDLKKRKK